MTLSSGTDTRSVDLDNCDREPIHVPGHIQPHGALLAFDVTGALVAWSANAPEFLSIPLTRGTMATSLAFDTGGLVQDLLAEAVAEAAAGDLPPTSLDALVNGQQVDVVVHTHAGRVIAEFERRDHPNDEVAAFVLKAHRGIDRLKRQRTFEALLNAAVHEVRALTGFDRVMAYRFRHDDSGEVVAEAHCEEMEPYLGRRYPATDIPAQARRLYILNTLRVIVDMNYAPVPVLGGAGDPPLDMSHCVLRSVSPIHIEYLQNMGVGASMSVSLVVNGKLWGMLACHHLGRLQVPYSIRMACDVLAQVISVTVQSLTAREEAEHTAAGAEVRTRIMESLLQAEDLLGALAQHSGDLGVPLEADAVVLAHAGKLMVHGDLSPELATAIIQALPSEDTGELITYQELAEWPESLQPSLGKWVGLLALCFDPTYHGWIVALRVEQIETVRWGGRPEKVVKVGPLGPRLTPRGSFAEWRETVRNKAIPWRPNTLEIARQLLGDLRRAVNSRYAEVDRARTQLLAMLGHDLRDPLNSISMAAAVLQQGGQQDKMGLRIQNATGRMQRLVSQVLDLSRIRSGLGLDITPVPLNLADLVRELVDEAIVARPGSLYELTLPAQLWLEADGDRIAQVISNLLSNARHHGETGAPIQVRLVSNDASAILEVGNVGQPIPPDLEATLFDPFKRPSLGNERNRTGMGLGLYIAREIVAGHHGAIRYEYAAPHVVFTVTLPLTVPVGATAPASDLT